MKLGTTQKKRLIINFIYLRQLYKRRKIAEIKQINNITNPADIIIKSKACDALKLFINNNCIELKESTWVIKDDIGAGNDMGAGNGKDEADNVGKDKNREVNNMGE